MFLSSFKPDRAGKCRIGGAPAGHEARLLAEAALRAPSKLVVHVALDDLRAAFLAEAIAFFAPHVEVLTFPAWDCLPYDRISPQADLSGQRVATLAALSVSTNKPRVLLTTVNAVLQRVLPPEVVKDTNLDLSVGASFPIEKLTRLLSARGYHSAGTVREVGEYAVRGGIVDLFPTGFDNPVRLDFFGDEVESIRFFDPLSQVSSEKLDAFSLEPTSEILLNEQSIALFRSGYRELFGVASDSDPLYEAVSAGQKFSGVEHWMPLFYPRLVSLFDYAVDAPVFFDPNAGEALLSRFGQIEDFYKSRLGLYEAARRGRDKNVVAYKPVPPERFFDSPAALDALLKDRATALFSPFQEEGESLDAGGQRGRNFADARARSDVDLYQEIKAYAAQHQAVGKRVLIACYSNGSAERIAGLLRSHDVNVQVAAKDWEQVRKLDVKLITLVVLGLEHGFVAPDMVVISEQDILGDRLVRQTKKRKASAQFQLELGSLQVGDFVVHAEHGIARYEGLEAINALGALHDCIRLIYDGGDKLFVPVENLDVLSRYASADAGAVLDKLGGVAWQARKARVKKRILEIAGDLIKIAAERQLRQAEIIECAEGGYQEFASRFPYNETDDQEQSIQAVLADLASGKPMDRLVCGDVGFGKTEVALRAAFAVASAGLQVAVVAPTTLLARQHYQNFVQRFTGFPMRIAQLSRMVTPKEAKQTKEEIRDGKVDIVIGTHALLGKEIKFQRLGLVIIDEEQHFGVKQKEQLKQLRTDVHVLTLTATPIPRTLQLALTGVRELSLITTPPVDRLAVSTYVLPFDPVVIREALMREHYRGGQSFYVCPRIEDLAALSEELRELAPELKLVSAHGRMSAGELDDIMNAFDGKKFDVLLATNIVESGLDIPNANTIILHRADMFGLAQLYQLRGRVGRSKQRGYAYFTYASKAPLSATAQQRLEVIATLDQLGAGFQLASHDMDIRGTGNLLGEEQSGHIREVGVELYQQMLEDAVAEAKSGGSGASDGAGQPTLHDHWTPQINIGLSVMIPETYVTDLNVRLSLYRRLADGRQAHEVEAIAAEMLDRFGPLPQEVENLLETMAIKQLCRRCGIAKLDAGPKGAVIGFHEDRFARPDLLIQWIASQAGTVKVRPDQKLVLLRSWDALPARLSGLKKALGEMANMVG